MRHDLFDLDPADLPEVRRRVVEPVLAAMLRPGELDRLDVGCSTVGATRWWPGAGDAETFVALAVEGEWFTLPLANADFWLRRAGDLAQRLAGELQDWICETTWGWGQLRELPPGWAPPPPPASPGGARRLGVYAATERGALPLWENGRLLDDARGLALDHELVDDLRRWNTLAHDVSEAITGAAGPDPDGAFAEPYGSVILFLTEEDIVERERQAREAATAKRSVWRRYVDALEPRRDALISRLRTTLGASFHIPVPPRLP